MERAVMDDSRDAFGHMLTDYVEGKGAFEIVERDDGFIGAASPAMYVAPYRESITRPVATKFGSIR
jgi:hypothetical protein